MIMILDYDDFGIYSNKDDIKMYIENLLHKGFEDQVEIYDMCIEEFGSQYTEVIDELFKDEE